MIKKENPKTAVSFDMSFWILCAFYCILYIVFYPPIYAYRDESIYLAMAEVLKRGTLFIEQTGIPVSSYIIRNGHWLPFYPLGNSLLIMVATLFSWKGMFCVGLFSHLVAAWYFKRLYALQHRAGVLAQALYLFYPAFVFYSRTAMSDLPSLALFMPAYFYYFRRDSKVWLTGILFGLSLFFRVTNLLVAFPFQVALVLRWGTCRDYRLRHFLFGFLPFALLAGIYNTLIYGGPLMSGYSPVFSGVRSFGLEFIRPHLIFYLISLNVAYPFMLCLFVGNQSSRSAEAVMLSVVLLMFYSAYYFIDSFPQPALRCVFGTRFLFPVIPFFILSFARSVEYVIEQAPQKLRLLLTFSILLLLGVSAFLIHRKHQNYLLQQEKAKNLIYSQTKENDTVIYTGDCSELIQSVWGKREYRYLEKENEIENLLNQERLGSDIYMVTKSNFFRSEPLDVTLTKIKRSLENRGKLQQVAKQGELSLYRISMTDPIQ